MFLNAWILCVLQCTYIFTWLADPHEDQVTSLLVNENIGKLNVGFIISQLASVVQLIAKYILYFLFYIKEPVLENQMCFVYVVTELFWSTHLFVFNHKNWNQSAINFYLSNKNPKPGREQTALYFLGLVGKGCQDQRQVGWWVTYPRINQKKDWVYSWVWSRDQS